ncbi:Mif2/CENP-C like-domain-containing protein [Mortierella sp. GBAus27b]|nr:Mif2/CENP-C like-domain-containing protein [Mortierella sp. GBAus27b]
MSILLAERNDQVHFRDAASGQYGIHSGPEDSNMCSGIISIPGKGLKPNQNAFLSTTIYCVIKGRVRATICRTSIIAGMGDSFMVPRGNQYMIENLSRDETRLFFVHSREAKKQGETVSDFAEYTELMGP